MTAPTPEISSLSAPFWNGLKEGVLHFQECRACGNRWLPARDACPRCLGDQLTWQPSCGRGKVVSWVVYHVAYDDAFKGRLPYDVTLVELEEGPRLLTNVVDSDAGRRLSIGASVKLKIERDGEVALARFQLGV